MHKYVYMEQLEASWWIKVSRWPCGGAGSLGADVKLQPSRGSGDKQTDRNVESWLPACHKVFFFVLLQAAVVAAGKGDAW